MNNASTSTSTVLDVRDLSVTLHTSKTSVRPVDRVSYSVNEGEVLAIVGESGSGKTILNLAPLGLLPPGVDADLEGSVRFEGHDLLRSRDDQLRSIRGGGIGVIFQDPLSSLNPVRKIGRQIAEVAEEHLKLTPKAAENRAKELLSLVGLPDPSSRLQLYPHELSGGQRQRVGIAMSIAGEPRLLIADEPTTALDVTVQAQIINLLKDLQKRLKMAIVIITHDFGVVSGLANKVAVMYAGRMAEIGSVDDVLSKPVHPYTHGLLTSVPTLKAAIGDRFFGLPGSPPDLSKRIHGCAFKERCNKALPTCGNGRSPLTHVPGDNIDHLAACPVVMNRFHEEMA